MTKFVVYFGGHADARVEVDAEDFEAAIEKAYEELPSGLCWSCGSNGSGMSDPGTMSREWPDVMDVYEVADADGKTVWSEKTLLEQLREENTKLRAALAKLKAGGDRG